MTTYLNKACIMYGNPGTWIFGGVGYEQGDSEYEQVERYDHVASDGTRASYYVGERRFITRTFRWQSDALMESWRTFFRTWGGIGKSFYYYDDQPPIYGDGSKFGDSGLKYGGGSTGVVVVLEDVEFRPEREEVDGYWSLVLTMRRA